MLYNTKNDPIYQKSGKFALKLGFIISISGEVNQKGNPVKFRSCTRSCKPTHEVSESMPLSGIVGTGRRRRPGEPEDLPISALFLLSGRTAEIFCTNFIRFN